MGNDGRGAVCGGIGSIIVGIGDKKRRIGKKTRFMQYDDGV